MKGFNPQKKEPGLRNKVVRWWELQDYQERTVTFKIVRKLWIDFGNSRSPHFQEFLRFTCRRMFDKIRKRNDFIFSYLEKQIFFFDFMTFLVAFSSTWWEENFSPDFLLRSQFNFDVILTNWIEAPSDKSKSLNVPQGLSGNVLASFPCFWQKQPFQFPRNKLNFPSASYSIDTNKLSLKELQVSQCLV